MSKRVRVGIIGCGVIAPTHVQSYQQVEGVEVTWACDLVKEKAQRLADTFAIPHVTHDLHAVLADPQLDAISVCTDHASHAPVTIAALDAGKHVLCEKALTATVDGIEQMCATHARHPELVFAGIFQHRFDPVNRYLKELVDTGAFGTVLTAGVQMRCLRSKDYYRADTWRGTWAEEGGAVLINQAIHYIDLLTWIMGGVQAVSGAYANITHEDVMETEDTAVAALRFRSGALGTLEATCSSHIHWEPTLSIHGSTGSIDLRHDKILKIAFDDEALGKEIEQRLRTCREHVGVEAGKTYYGTGHPAQVADFVEAVRGEHPPFVSGEAARHTVEVVLAIYRSHRAGQWVRL